MSIAPLRFSISDSMRKATYKRCGDTWEGFVQKLDVSNPKRKKDRGNIVGGVFHGDYRLRENLESRSILTLDADYASTGFAAEAPMELDCAAVLYTTWKHMTEDYGPRWRLFAPLSREVTEEEYWSIAWAVMHDLGEEQFDPGSAEAERLMHLPSTRGGEYGHLTVPGDPLDVDKWLARAGELDIRSRDEQDAVIGSSGAYDGPAYADLTPAERAWAKEHVDGVLAGWQSRLDVARKWDDGVTDSAGRSWEALAYQFAWALAKMVACPWTGLTVEDAREHFASLMGDMSDAEDAQGKPLSDKWGQRTLDNAAKKPVDLPPWDGIEAVAETCSLDPEVGMWGCTRGLFDFEGIDFKPITVDTKAHADEINSGVRQGILRANRTANVPTFVIRDGVLIRIKYDQVARIVKHDKDTDGSQVCMPQALVVTREVLAPHVAKAVRFLGRDRGGKIIPLGTVPSSPVNALLNAGDLPDFPVVKSIGSVPIVGLHGNILVEPKYYGAPDFHLLTPDMETKWRAVPDAPSDAEYAEAVKWFKTLLAGFPFDDDASRANALAMILSPALRKHYGVGPVFVIDAADSQTGKTLLASLVQILWQGRVLVSTMPSERTEMRKFLHSALLGGETIILLDNLDSALTSGPLASAITAPYISDRVLGQSRVASVTNDAVYIITGNNVVMSVELVKREARIRLDAHNSKPEGREFDIELPSWAFEHRADLVWAAHVLIRKWFNDGKPEGSIGETSSGATFSQWAALLGGIVGHTKEFPGFMDTYLSGRDGHVDDEEFSEQSVVGEVMRRRMVAPAEPPEGWVLPSEWVSPADVYNAALEAGQQSREFLSLVNDNLGEVNLRSLGRLMARVSRRTFHHDGVDYRIVRKGDKRPLYRLIEEGSEE